MLSSLLLSGSFRPEYERGSDLPTEAEIIVTGVVVAAVIYPVVMRVLAQALQPMRLNMADMGNDLLGSPKLTEPQKKQITSMLDDAFEWRFMLVAVLFFPALVVRKALGRLPQTPLDRVSDKETEKLLDRFMIRLIVSLAAANPICFVILGFEFVVIVFPAALARKLANRHLDFKYVARKVVVTSDCHLRASDGFQAA